MIIKKLLMPLLLVTQICYGADEVGDKLTLVHQELVNVLATLDRIKDITQPNSTRLKFYSA